MKRLLFDTGSILTTLSPLILAAYFITQGGARVDTAAVIVETSELRPAITEVSEAAEAARLSGDTVPLLQVIDDLYVLRDSAAEGVLMVLPEGAGGPLLSELNTALDEFTGSVAAFATTAAMAAPARPPSSGRTTRSMRSSARSRSRRATRSSMAARGETARWCSRC